MKPIKGYNWKFDRVSSKGKVIFKHDTKETLEDVKNYLQKNNIYYEETKAKMLRVYYNEQMYSYFYTTGRWSPYIGPGKYPKQHYYSKNINDFITRFLEGGSNETH